MGPRVVMPTGHRPCSPRLAGPRPAVAVVPDACPAARRMSCHVRGGCRRDHHVACWRPADGRRRTSVQGVRPPVRVCRAPAVRTVVVPEAADGQYADDPGSLQLPLRFLKAGLRVASGRPPARQPHDGQRQTGLTLHTGGTRPLPWSDAWLRRRWNPSRPVTSAVDLSRQRRGDRCHQPVRGRTTRRSGPRRTTPAREAAGPGRGGGRASHGPRTTP